MALIKLRLSAPLTLPAVCACCGEAPTQHRESQRAIFRRQQRRVVPYCDRCAVHVDLWTREDARANAIGVAGYAASVVASGITGSPLGALGFAASLVVALVLSVRGRAAARRECGAECAAAGPAVVDLFADGTGFTSEPYAVLVARENPAALLAAPPLIRAQLAPPRAIVVRARERDGSSNQ